MQEPTAQDEKVQDVVSLALGEIDFDPDVLRAKYLKGGSAFPTPGFGFQEQP